MALINIFLIMYFYLIQRGEYAVSVAEEYHQEKIAKYLRGIF